MNNQRGSVIVIVLITLLLIVSIAFAYFIGTQQEKPLILQFPQESEIPEVVVPTSTPAYAPSASPKMPIPAGWKTYTNENYGFEISYPPSYQALTDSNSLYGWPKAIVLFYNGGQSYDLAVEYWSNETEYKNKYKNQTNLTVKKVGNFFITLLNTNFEEEVNEMIETFKPI